MRSNRKARVVMLCARSVGSLQLRRIVLNFEMTMRQGLNARTWRNVKPAIQRSIRESEDVQRTHGFRARRTRTA
eukprot:4116003-Prymnesium_polylepis.1